MTVVSTVTSCRDSCRQRSFPDEIICMRASNRTPLTRSQRSLTSDILRRPLSNHVLSASAEHVVVSKTVAIPKQSTRIDLPRYIIRKHYRNVDGSIDPRQIRVAKQRLPKRLGSAYRFLFLAVPTR